MPKDDKIYYFICSDNLAVLKGIHNENIFKGNYKFKFFGERSINFNSNLLSNEKTILMDNEKSSLKAYLVFWDLLRNQPYTENLNISLIAENSRLQNETKRLQKENNFLQQRFFNLKGTDMFKEGIIDEVDFGGKLRSKFYQYSSMGGEGGLDSGLWGRYGGYSQRTIIPEQGEQQL